MSEEFDDIPVVLSLNVEETSQHDVMLCIALAERFSRPSTVLDKRDVERLTRVAKVQRAFWQERARRWLAQRHDRPILVQYGSDLTPLMTRERVSAQCEGLSVLRSGRSCSEFLVQRCYMSDLQGSSVCLVDQPWRLTDKSAWAHFAAYRSFMKTPREQGHVGLCVLAHVYDRAVQTPSGATPPKVAITP